MKKFFLFWLCLMPLIAFAQEAEGTVYYKETIKIEIPEEMRRNMNFEFPESRSVTKMLYFSPTESVFKDAPESEQDEVAEGGPRGMRFMMRRAGSGGENVLYKNLDTGEITNKQNFFGRDFLISAEEDLPRWKLTGDEGTYLGYVCQRALIEDSTGVVAEAWFTPQIPVASGPENFGQLPGLILSITTNGGDRTFVATKIELGALPEGTIVPPTKGQKVTQAEFEKIMEEKRKEMEAMYGNRGGGSRVIFRRN